MLKTKTIVIANMRDPRFQAVVDDCMMVLTAGVLYHVRLDTIFVIQSMLEVTPAE